MADTPDWHIVGDWFDNCSCAIACPCTFAQAPDNGYCNGVLLWHVTRGHYGDVVLDDLVFVRVGRWEGDLWAGKVKGRAGVFIDDRADDAQADALAAIIGGRAGGFMAKVNDLFTGGREIVGVERATDIVRDRPGSVALGSRHRGQGQGLGGGADRADQQSGRIPEDGERAGIGNRAGAAAGHLGKVDRLQRRRLRFRILLGRELGQAHPVRLDGTVVFRAGQSNTAAPAATRAAPSSLVAQIGKRGHFSSATRTVRNTIQTGFITPATNSSSISAQQHPAQ